jgi:hypothetical protein
MGSIPTWAHKFPPNTGPSDKPSTPHQEGLSEPSTVREILPSAYGSCGEVGLLKQKSLFYILTERLAYALRFRSQGLPGFLKQLRDLPQLAKPPKLVIRSFALRHFPPDYSPTDD